MIRDFEPIAPYDFKRTAACSRLYATTHAITETGLHRVFRVGDALALVRVTGTGGAAPRLRAECIAAQGRVDEDILAREVRRWLAVDVALTDFYQAAQGDAVLRRIVERLHGLHLLRTPSMFEALVVTMIEQQIALSAAQKAERWLVETYGESITHDGGRYHAFPTAAVLAQLDEAALTPLKITFVRMRRILALARAVCDGSLDLESLREGTPQYAHDVLLRISGVGHWTAAWTINRTLGVYRYIGSADVALRAAVNHYWHGLPGRAGRAETDAHFAAFGAYAGEACVYTLIALGLERYPQANA